MYVNIPRLRGVSKSLVLNARGKKLASRVTCGAETRKARKKRLLIRPCLSHLRRCSCPFRKRSLPFLRHLENFSPVIESVSMKNKGKLQPRVKLGLESEPFVSSSRSLTTTLPHGPAKIPNYLS